MGGFARRVRYFNAFAGKYPGRAVLHLDGGSLFAVGSVEAPVVNRWMLEGTYRSHLDALNLSAWDLTEWQEMADLAATGRLPRELLSVPLVSANASPRITNFPIVHRYIIKEFPVDAMNSKKMRVAVTGLLSDPEERIPHSDFQIIDPLTAARQFVEEVEGRANYRIILTDMDIGSAISLAIDVPKIDLIVVAHNYESVSEPQQVGQTLIVIPVNEGRMISEVRMTIKPGNDTADVETRFVPLDATVPDDPAMADLVRKAQAALDQFKKED
jgi:2',3'-cyclic-nucleotide 2'-phosphodiesterase (5'-nucleotidase family)